jgi:hypothetical protein
MRSTTDRASRCKSDRHQFGASLKHAHMSNLVIGNQDHSLWEETAKSPVGCLCELTSNAFVSTDSDNRWSPVLRQGCRKKAERLFGQCYPGIIPLFVDKVQGSTKEL